MSRLSVTRRLAAIGRWLAKNYSLLLGAVGATYLLVIFGHVLTEIIATTHSFSCPFADGCFQLYNPLRRLAAGQIPGQDFQFFYGLGSLLVHYPIFSLLGGNLFASEAAKHLLSPLLFLLASYLVIKRAVDKRGLAVFLTASLSLLASNLFPSVIYPGNSLFGVRTALPIIISVVLFGLARHRHKAGAVTKRKRLFEPIAALGLLGGLALLISPDQGLFALAALILVWPLVFGWSVRAGFSLLFCLLGAAAVMLVGYRLIAGSAWLKSLAFAFADLPTNQLWYFGGPPNPFIGSWDQLLVWLVSGPLFSAFAVMAMLIILFRRQLSRPIVAWLAYLLGFGLLSSASVIGYVKPEYLNALAWTLALTAFALAWSLYRGLKTTPKTAYVLRGATLGVLLVTMAAMASDAICETGNNLGIAFEKINSSQHHTLGVRLGATWLEHQQLANDLYPDSGHPLVWSTYASLFEAELGTFHPDTDYIIHAIGPERRARYMESFKESRPQLVRTTDPSWRFEPWLWQAHWPLYRYLLANYELAGQTENGVFWRRQSDAWQEPPNDWAVGFQPDEAGRILLPANDSDRPRVMTVRLRYSISNPWANLPMVGRSARYLVEPTGLSNPYAIALPPDETVWEFPVMILPHARHPSLRLAVRTMLPDVSLKATAVQWREETISDTQAALFFPEPRKRADWYFAGIILRETFRVDDSENTRQTGFAR